MIVAAVDFQTLSDALGLGAIYALMAVGIGLVFGILRLVNFAYGQLVMAGAYTLAFTSAWPVPLSIAACFGVVVALSLAMETVVFRPLRGQSPAVMLTVQNPLVSPDFALRDTIVVLVGVVVGGIDRLWSATLGGFAIGFAKGVLDGILPSAGNWPFASGVYLDSAVFALVILVLLVRPSGLFVGRGRRPVERV